MKSLLELSQDKGMTTNKKSYLLKTRFKMRHILVCAMGKPMLILGQR